MSEEFNIFKNLDDLRNTNLLKDLIPLESTVDLNDSQDLANDDFDFDSPLNNKSVKKTPTKRQPNKGKKTTQEKHVKKKVTSRRSSISTDGSISPLMPLLENLSNKVDEVPLGRRTRNSSKSRKEIDEVSTIIESIVASSPKGRGKAKGRGRKQSSTRGRGRGGGSISGSASNLQNNFIGSSLSNSSSLAYDEQLPSLNLNIMESVLQLGSRGRRRGGSQVMRGRRQCLAEIAARCTQVDFIDLVSSPMPRVEGFIDLGSDTEEAIRTTRSKMKNQIEFSSNSEKNKNSTSTLNISLDEDNPEINIKVNWKGKVEAFKLRKHQKFSIIFQQLAERENISIDSVVFNLNDRIIMADDTPDSINYKIFQFIDGRVLLSRFNSAGSAAPVVRKRDPNQMTLKIQSDKWKRPLQINIMKSDQFRILYIKCAEELKVDVDQLKLSFDGELLELNGTATDLDLEGGEAIDLRVKN